MRFVLNISKSVCALFLALCMVALHSCGQWEPEETSHKTVIVYMAGDNDLYPAMAANLSDMAAGMDPVISSYNNVVVFVDRPQYNPVLLNIRDNRIDTVHVWPQQVHSSSSRVLAEVISMAASMFPAEEYTLVFSGHGTGWLPAKSLKSLDRFLFPQTVIDIEQESGAPAFAHRTPFAGMDDEELPAEMAGRIMGVTKAAFAEILVDNTASWMDVDRMTAAIPDGMFDCIVFDACLMGGVEFAYALRNKADQIVVSSVEIMKQGFPYRTAIGDIVRSDYSSVCRDFYEFYKAKTGIEKTAGVALIDMKKLDKLASAFSRVVNNATVRVDDVFSDRNLQHFDRFVHHAMFDLADVVERLKPDEESLSVFRQALSECVSSCYNTGYVCSELALNRYCGLSCYLPVAQYQGLLNDSYARTDWNQAVGFYKTYSE